MNKWSYWTNLSKRFPWCHFKLVIYIKSLSFTCSVSIESLAQIYQILCSSFVLTVWILFVVAVCIKDTKTAVSGGQVSRKLSYKDHVLELTYEGGSPCAANPNIHHKTIIHFICRYFRLCLILHFSLHLYLCVLYQLL